MTDRRLMAVFAHPDDESFAGTGAIVRYAREGAQVSLVCATLGERGRAGDPPLCTPSELPGVRERELRAACRVLGVEEIRLLGYKDKEVDQAEEKEAVGRIVSCMRELRPHVVYTFPPDGHSGHPDHQAINRLTGLAFRAAGDPLAYPGTGPAWQPDRLFWSLLPTGHVERVDAALAVADTISTRIEALRCHRTQHVSIGLWFRAFDPTFMQGNCSEDLFHLADGVGAWPGQVLSDLFDGLPLRK